VVNVFLWWRCLRRGGGRSGFFFRLPFLAGLSSHDLSLEAAESHARRRGFQLRGQSLLGLGIVLVFYGVMYQNRNVRASRTSTVLTATPFERRRRVCGVGWTISMLPGKLLYDTCAGSDFLEHSDAMGQALRIRISSVDDINSPVRRSRGTSG
jgi:hypothetical protein